MAAQPIDMTCPNEVGTYLAESHAGLIQDRAVEILGDWISSLRDGYADAKADREFRELRQKMLDAVFDANEARAHAAWQEGKDARAEMAAERRAAA